MSVTRTAPPAYRPPQRPQEQSVRKPAAPPVYHGNQNPAVLRSVPSLLPERREIRPAPPVYRPQFGNGQQPLPLQRKVPSPPRVYRPAATGPNAAKIAGISVRQGAPAVYRPQQAANVAPGGVQCKQPNPPVYRPGHGHQQTAAQPAFAPRVGSQGSRISGPAVVQPYFVIPTEKIFSNREAAEAAERPAALISGGGMFASQALRENSFLNSSGGANIQALDRSALRVSDDCEMAIEHSDLKTRQPKTFFATEAALGNAQRARGAKADYELQSGGGRLSIWNSEGEEKVLSMVFPQSTREPVERPFDLRTPEACDQLAQGVSGSPYAHMAPTCKDRLPVQNVSARSDVASAVAELVATLMQTSKRKRLLELNVASLSSVKKRKIVEQIAQEYTNALQQGGSALKKHLKTLQLNQFADPGIGETFLIASVAVSDIQDRVYDLASRRQFKPKWPYHFATVVAKSGTDSVTLENYARNESEGAGAVSPSGDPRWYFQMYSQNKGQSFHEAWNATGEFANPVTMTMQPQGEWFVSKERRELVTRERARDDRELAARAAAYNRRVTIGRLTVGFLLLAIAVGVMYRYGLYPSLENLRLG